MKYERPLGKLTSKFHNILAREWMRGRRKVEGVGEEERGRRGKCIITENGGNKCFIVYRDIFEVINFQEFCKQGNNRKNIILEYWAFTSSHTQPCVI